MISSKEWVLLGDLVSVKVNKGFLIQVADNSSPAFKQIILLRFQIPIEITKYITENSASVFKWFLQKQIWQKRVVKGRESDPYIFRCSSWADW